MSVIVKGIKMPGACTDCPLFRESAYGFGFCKGKGIWFGAEDAEWLDATRPNWCPLCPLPEKHGRLIDGDELADGCDDPRWCRWLSEIEDMPTIVEAEGDER